MWVYDPVSLRFLIVNEAAVELYGYSPADYQRMTVLDIRPESERQRMLEAMHWLLEAGIVLHAPAAVPGVAVRLRARSENGGVP